MKQQLSPIMITPEITYSYGEFNGAIESWNKGYVDKIRIVTVPGSDEAKNLELVQVELLRRGFLKSEVKA